MKVSYNWLQNHGFLVIIALSLLSCNGKREPDLLIATAANAHVAIKKIAEKFSSDTGIACQVIAGSSGKLTAQISEGAPYDIFVSADMSYPQYLFEKGLTLDTPFVYAEGKLILWSVNDNLELDFDVKCMDQLQSLALANPRTAPYGMAAIEALTNVGLIDIVRKKLVYGESIGQTNQFILSANADAGITSYSSLFTAGLPAYNNWILIPSESYTPLLQGAVTLVNSRSPVKAKAFTQYIRSDEAKHILIKYGF